ncbi:hypothetical protein [Phaffia rhodozyma]|uniref:Uncharacterized protein n=1 Tax=Phaffia rhodozyma TaxID=264483 RepID=A0A0F7SWJ8_PHARH|nr:hypothetical protein [Phaffia rhodozyma]
MSNISQPKKPYKKRGSNVNSGNDQPRAFFHIPSTSVNSTSAVDRSSDPNVLGLSEAELYLLSVRAEEASLPTFTKALNPYALASATFLEPSGDTFQKESVPSPTLIGPSASPRHPLLPSEAWRLSFLLHFSNLRQNLLALSHEPSKKPSIILPKASDESAWTLFIFGAKRRRLADLAKAEATFIPTSRDVSNLIQDDEEAALNESVDMEDWQLDEDMEERQFHCDDSEGDDQNDNEEEQLNDHIEGGDNVPEDELEPFDPGKHSPKEPSMLILQAMSDKAVIYLLKHITSWIIESPSNLPQTCSPSIPPILAYWSFSLLTRLDAHLLSGESISDLRSLARACLAVIERQLELYTTDQEGSNTVRLRQQSRQEDEDERMACWMIWELVVEVWKQRDLRQEEEALFK